MEKIQRILAATDFSSRADQAVRRAAKLAVEHKAVLYLLRVLPSLPLEAFKHLMTDTPLETEQRLYNEATAILHKKAEILAGEGIDVRYHVAIGRAHVEINHYAESHQVDLVVIGDQGESFLQEFFLGTTASKTLTKGHHPLLIVKQEAGERYHRVLVPVDFSYPSRLALQMALKVIPAGIAPIEASIHVLHAVDAPLERKMQQNGLKTETIELYRADVLNRARCAMENIIVDCASGDARVNSIIEYGAPPDMIRAKAQSLGADLIVIGKRGETELDETLFGSVTKHVLYETPCDVLVVSP
ncbi:universal stress protein [Nitrosospira lacus]|uniref:Universal stress protein n=1 Tax=Nitrosospira lacus TaxID=1288494 RepID=A0A1W6SS11_9PROT|nr:universal stress protein [Nitrosospira lacus]ARO88610.1 universal stress protein [Nitrosospira lacus]